MVKKLLFLSWLFFSIWSWFIFAENIQDKSILNIEFDEKIEENEKSFKFKSEKLSCWNLNKKLTNFFEENKEYLKHRYSQRIWMLEKSSQMIVEDSIMANSSDWIQNSIDSSLKRESSESSFSQTNIQKENVDEPEILKINENIFAYLHSWIWFNYSQKQKIEILSWNKKIKEVHSEIKIPENFYASNLLLYKDKLLVLWTRNIEKRIENTTRTTILVINIKNSRKPKIEQVFDLSWLYQDSRLIWNMLYTFSDNYIHLNYDKIYWDKKIDFNIQDYLSNWIHLQVNNWKVIVNKDKLNCEDIQIFLPNQNTIKQFWLNLWISTIWIIDLEKNILNQKVFFWNWIERHVTTNSIYLVQNEYRETFEKWCWNIFWKCWYNYEEFSLIHKFNINKLNWNIEYNSSNFIKWSSTNWQYAIDENENWKLRIVTSQNQWTNVFVLDKDLNIIWKLLWIQKDEHFKASRFLWDKLYLVTFKRTDPFFVIDLSKDKPTILWELKIPWYSTYLHEYEKERNWKHLILWLWYDAEDNWRFAINKWIKVDLYEIDYTKKDIWIKQLWTKVLWDKWSFSPSLENPRTFVFDKENKNLILPVILSKEIVNKECYDNNFKCYDHKKTVPEFFWTKILHIENNWNINVIWEIDWLKIFNDEIKKKFDENNHYSYDYMTMLYSYLQDIIFESRTWYLWKNYFFLSTLWYTDWNQKINF